MLDLDIIRRKIGAGEYDLTEHAFVRVVERNLDAQAIREAGAGAELIEDYPNDKNGPSSLLLGFTRAGTPLHLQVSRLENPRVKIIALNVPGTDRWADFRYRRARP